MKKVWKKVAVLIAALCLTLTCALFAACGESETTYTVKVVLPDADESPVEGVELTFCDEEDESKTQPPVRTNADGIAKVTCETANYRVKITGGIPEGYTLFNADSEIYCTRTWTRSSCIITLDEATRTYTVTVTLPGGSTPAPGVDVIFTPESADADTETVTTGTDGKASVTLPADVNYIVTLDNGTIPENYVVSASDENGISTLQGTSIAFTLERPVNYSFTVTGPAEANLEGIEISYSATVSGNRTLLGVTDENGNFTLTRSEVKGFAFIKAPDGYVYNENYDEVNSPYLLKTKGTTKFTLIRNNALSFETGMTDSEIKAFNRSTMSPLAKEDEALFATTMAEVGRTAYWFETVFAADEMQLFSFRAESTGSYSIFANFSNAEINAYTTLNLSNVYTNLPSKSMAIIFNCTQGETYYFSIKANDAAQSIQYVVATPAEKNETTVEQAGEYDLTIKNSLPAMLSFRPSESGEYTLEIINGGSGYLIEEISPHSFTVMDTSTDGTIAFNISRSELFYPDGTRSNAIWLFRFTSADENPDYPIDISIRIRKTGEVIEKTSEMIYVTVQERLTPQTVPNGVLTQIGVINSNNRIVSGSDGFYHLDSATGPVVYVKLKGTIPVFYPSDNFTQLDENSAFYMFLHESTETKNIYYNYAEMLRGYKTYEDVDKTDQYADEYYLKYVNKDGVYPLNDELKEFLKLVAHNQAAYFASCVKDYDASRDRDSLWLFSACYYDPSGAPPEEVDTDFEGSGTESDPYMLSFESGETSLTKGFSADDNGRFCTFTAQTEGTYVVTLLTSGSDIATWDGVTVGETENGVLTYTFTLAAGDSENFLLTATNPSIVYVFSIELK